MPSVRRPDRANRRSQPQSPLASERLPSEQAAECLHSASAALSRLPHLPCRCRPSPESSSLHLPFHLPIQLFHCCAVPLPVDILRRTFDSASDAIQSCTSAML